MNEEIKKKIESGEIIHTPIDDGYIEPVIKPEDYIYGAGQVPDEIIQSDGQWDNFLPNEEIQVKNFETFGCTVFNANNQIETQERRLYGLKPNYSDRALYIQVGIAPPGTDPQRVYESIRNQGLVNEEDMPWENLKSLEEYNQPKPLPKNLIDKALSWLFNYVFKHEYLPWTSDWIDKEVMKEVLKRSVLAVPVQAWAQKGDRYIRIGQDTHWTTIYGYVEGAYWKCFDSYPPFQKKLDWDFGFKYAKRIYLRKKTEKEKETELKAKLTILHKIVEALKKLIAIFQKKKVEEIISLDEITVLEIIKEKYKWDTPAAACHSVRVICDEEGLSVADKNLIAQVINCESGFNIKAKNDNKNSKAEVTSTDYGICQYNSYWYIGAGKPIASIEEALNNPEKCVRVMIGQFKKGRLKDWVCYSHGKYRNYPSKVA